MQALVKTRKGAGNVELVEVPEPRPDKDEVLVRVEAAGVCGTDIHIFHDTFKNRPPVIMGHELSGVVVDKGNDCVEFQEGDRVTCESSLSFCGRCRYCRTGRYNLCANRKIAGVNADGGFARYIAVAERCLHRLPEGVDFVGGALFEPLAVTVLGVSELAGVAAGDLVYVSGPGPLGLMAAQVARAEGATVIVGGRSRDKERLALGKSLGIDYTVNVERNDPRSMVDDLSEGYGADVVVECAGHPSSVSTCLEVVRRGGRYCQIGLFGKSIEVDFEKIPLKQLKVSGPLAQYWPSWRRAIELTRAGKVRLRELVTHVLPLSEWEAAFRLHERNEGLKKVLVPN
ncbi:MAG: zinc-binding dehydrogenase [Deltaproteobacteria bacterium]|nr:zinc-binding dehydrogenase [Deltaproteobacteria bacterium]